MSIVHSKLAASRLLRTCALEVEVYQAQAFPSRPKGTVIPLMYVYLNGLSSQDEQANV